MFFSSLKKRPDTPRRTTRWIATFMASAFVATLGMELAQAAGKTGLPLPRFVSLRKDEVNLRTGPGRRYPVDWVYKYQNMPVEIVAEFETWRKVRDWRGTMGWVHKSMLSGRRWIMVRKERQPMRRAGEAEAPVVAHVDANAIGRLKQCRQAWCQVDFSGVQGWIQRSVIWGVYPDEKIR